MAESAPESWTDTERALWAAFREGEVFDLRCGRNDIDDPFGDAVWGPERTVSAEVLAHLLLAGPRPTAGRWPSPRRSG